MRGFYFITDKELSRKDIFNDVENAILAGAKLVQYRNKCDNTKEMHDEAIRIKKICKGKALFIINDRIDIAIAVDADGVHLGQDDMPLTAVRKLLGKKIIGRSSHSVEEAVLAEKEGVDYISVGPIFATKTKKDAKSPVDINLLKDVKKNVKKPVCAIGGINLSNAKEVIDAGADLVCAIAATVASDDVKSSVLKFVRMF